MNVLALIPPGPAAAGLRRVVVFGNRAVMEANVYGSILAEAAVKLALSLIDEVHAVCTLIALDGKRGPEAELRFLAGAASGLIDRDDGEAILLAGTDLSSFYSDAPSAYPHLDVAGLHIDWIVQLARTQTGMRRARMLEAAKGLAYPEGLASTLLHLVLSSVSIVVEDRP